MNSIAQLLDSGPPYPEKEFTLSGYSFAEIYQMAGWLQNYFASPEFTDQTICLAADNKAIIAASLLASLADGPVILLPFAFSSNALAEMQQTTGFTTAISDIKRDFPPGTHVICPEPRKSSNFHYNSAYDPNAELLRLFTGGSTGAPKSWSKTADNLFSEAFYLAEKYTITSDDLIVATVSPYHIYGLLFSVIIPFITSATVLADTPSFPAEITQAVKNNSATILASVPLHYRILKGRTTSNTSLRLAFSSAGMLDQADNEDFGRQNNTAVVEVYGSTETGGIATRNRFAGEQAFFPFDTVEWKISQQRLEVKSPYISPSAVRDDNGFFLTGDQVEQDTNTCFFLKGRSDAITKVAGKRVDLEEIRDKIKCQTGVDDCIVVSLASPGGRENIIAALIQGSTIDTDQLRKSLKHVLEPYALPRLIKKTATIPMTASGKYNRTAIEQLFS